jgi:hypothetical protein
MPAEADHAMPQPLERLSVEFAGPRCVPESCRGDLTAKLVGERDRDFAAICGIDHFCGCSVAGMDFYGAVQTSEHLSVRLMVGRVENQRSTSQASTSRPWTRAST